MSPADAGTGLPADVEDFLRELITSVNELHLLLHLQRHGHRYWSATDAAAATYLPDEWVADQLERFTSKGLLDRRPEAPVAFRLRGEHSRVLERVGDALRTRRHRVVEAVHGSPRSSAERFADAFRLRPEEDQA